MDTRVLGTVQQPEPANAFLPNGGTPALSLQNVLELEPAHINTKVPICCVASRLSDPENANNILDLPTELLIKIFTSKSGCLGLYVSETQATQDPSFRTPVSFNISVVPHLPVSTTLSFSAALLSHTVSSPSSVVGLTPGAAPRWRLSAIPVARPGESTTDFILCDDLFDHFGLLADDVGYRRAFFAGLRMGSTWEIRAMMVGRKKKNTVRGEWGIWCSSLTVAIDADQRTC